MTAPLGVQFPKLLRVSEKESTGTKLPPMRAKRVTTIPLKKLEVGGYPSEEMKEADFNALAAFLGISRAEFEALLALPPKSHDDYPKSFLSNKLIPFLLKYRRFLRV